MRSVLIAVAILFAVPSLPLGPVGASAVHPAFPEAAAGFTITALSPVPAATALAFGPGTNGQDLYATTLAGTVVRIPLVWTATGPVANGIATVAGGFSSPLGIVFEGDAFYVADSHSNPVTGRNDGRITLVDDGVKHVVVDGLPNGRHNTNHLRFGPDGRLYIANGNPNDNGRDGGDADVLPYSGAVLSFDTSVVTPSSPAVFEWTDGLGNLIAPTLVAGHAVNADFRAAVPVYGSGFRNIFGIAFGPTGIGYTAMNGADEPSSQDTLHKIVPGTDYGFPFCYNEGLAGATAATGGITVVTNPTFPGHDCSAVPPATALLGWHTCTTGLDFPTQGPFAFPATMHNSVFVGECFHIFAQDWAVKMLADPSTHSASHKVARVELDANGDAVRVQDFVTGLAATTDVLFGPDGAMYIADAEMVYRVAPAGPADPDAPAPTPEDLVPPSPSPGTVPPLPQGVTVRAAAFQFVPALVSVPVGTTVTWQSNLLGHTVTTASSIGAATNGDANDPGNSDADAETFRASVPQGSSFSHAFSRPGIFSYFCEPHVGAGMVGVVVVV